jgi:hypothetical protein
MRTGRAIFGALAIVVACGTTAWADQPGDAGQADPHARLIRVDVFDAAKGGKPAPSAANCSNAGATSADEVAFTGWVTAGGTAHLNAATIPASISSAAAELQSAFSTLSATGAPAFTVVNDGMVTRQTANRQTDLMFGRVSGNSIAVTYTWRWNDGQVESDTVFNQGLSWRNLGVEGDGCYESQPYYDLQNIAVHEFGHIYGLDHPNPGRFETMYAYGYTGETLKRSLGAGDLAALAQLY